MSTGTPRVSAALALFAALGGCALLSQGDSGSNTPPDAGQAGGPNRPEGSAGANGETSATPWDGESRPMTDANGRTDGDLQPMRGPLPPTNGVNFPFPQNRQSKGCGYPTGYRNEDVNAAYQQWRNDTVTSSGAGGFLRVQRLASDPALQTGSTVSEGIGYGMLIAVYMGDQPLFDALWKYEQLHLDKFGLMDWYISADGSMSLGLGGATDADEDMAFALVMADRQWGGQGTLSKTYQKTAIEQITAVWVHEVLNSDLMLPGDSWGDNTTVNISYFAPAYYRTFKTFGGALPMPGGGNYNPTWDATIDTAYRTINGALNATNGNQNNGLVPAWCTSGGAPNANAIMGGNPTNYQYDSCRTPFRIALDWCWNAEPRAQAYIAKTSAFFSGIGVQNIADGYGLNGTPMPQNPGKLSAAFIGPAGVGAMGASTYQFFLDSAYTAIATRTLLAGGAYYEDSWTVLSLLMMTGNFLNYTMLP
jgi:endo-1,4-beta-D-glucanase Y